MPGVDGAAILSVWERSAGQSLGDRAIAFLELSDVEPARAASMTAGMRDAELLRIRRLLFGDRIEAVISCESCDETLDLLLSVEQLLAEARPAPQLVHVDASAQSFYFRVPTADDLASLRGIGDVEEGVTFLIERCLSSDREELSSASLAALDDVLAAADPAAEFLLTSVCAACGHKNEALLDIPSFFSKELQALAHDVLWDVHTLARAYGWDERAILQLAPLRRRFYLEAIQQ